MALVQPDAASLAQAARQGLDRQARTPRRVVVVGAGMAGLVAAYELLQAGHDPIILEARARVGGRVHTVREPFTDGLYAELGAMRIPKSHHLTHAYCRRFGLPLVPFTASNPNGYVYLHGRRFRLHELATRPECLEAFDLAVHERGRPIEALWSEALADFATEVSVDPDAAWRDIGARYDGFSTREFLELKGWSEGAIEVFGLLMFQEALMNASFLELLREELGHCYSELEAIEGGMDRLPRAFVPDLERRIRFGAELFALDQDDQSVTVHYRTPGGRFSERGDFAVVTVPFPVLRHVEILKPFTAAKQRAIRQLHYDASAKILMQFRRRFWEEDEGIFGGGSVTDLPVRAVYYPDHGRGTARGIVLASYTWSEDAQRWGSLSASERMHQALENLTCLHPQASEEFETGISHMWHDDKYAGGAFALFDPGQQARLHDTIVSPEGRIWLAGEHASLAHAWIQGAIESGLRAALQICEQSA